MKRIFDNFNITKEGKIIRLKDNKTMMCCIDSAGYVKFAPRFEGVQFQVKVHRLVAMKYLDNPNNLPIVNHKNGIKTDNRVENLEWCDCKHNIRHAHKNKLATNKHLNKRVKQIDVETNKIINVFNSYREASIHTKISEQNISQVCRKYKPKNRPFPRQTAGGFKWETCND